MAPADRREEHRGGDLGALPSRAEALRRAELLVEVEGEVCGHRTAPGSLWWVDDHGTDEPDMAHRACALLRTSDLPQVARKGLRWGLTRPFWL